MAGEDFKSYLKANALDILILICVIILIIMTYMYKHEGYIGNPLSNMRWWDSGGALRRTGTSFSSTNQGSNFVGSKDPPYYTAPWSSDYDYNSASITGDTSADTSMNAGAESYAQPSAGKFDDNYLAKHHLY